MKCQDNYLLGKSQGGNSTMEHVQCNSVLPSNNTRVSEGHLTVMMCIDCITAFMFLTHLVVSELGQMLSNQTEEVLPNLFEMLVFIFHFKMLFVSVSGEPCRPSLFTKRWKQISLMKQQSVPEGYQRGAVLLWNLFSQASSSLGAIELLSKLCCNWNQVLHTKDLHTVCTLKPQIIIFKWKHGIIVFKAYYDYLN